MKELFEQAVKAGVVILQKNIGVKGKQYNAYSRKYNCVVFGVRADSGMYYPQYIINYGG